MTTQLDKTLKRQIRIKGQDYIVALSPEGLKLTGKGKRKGLELAWTELISGDAALAVALNASVGRLTPPSAPAKQPAQRERLGTGKRRPRRRTGKRSPRPW